MTRQIVLGVVGALIGSATLAAQIALPPGASPQATQDPGYQAVGPTSEVHLVPRIAGG